jgi:hypothetical protein
LRSGNQRGEQDAKPKTDETATDPREKYVPKEESRRPDALDADAEAG